MDQAAALISASCVTHQLPVSSHLIGEGGRRPLLAVALTILCILEGRQRQTTWHDDYCM